MSATVRRPPPSPSGSSPSLSAGALTRTAAPAISRLSLPRSSATPGSCPPGYPRPNPGGGGWCGGWLFFFSPPPFPRLGRLTTTEVRDPRESFTAEAGAVVLSSALHGRVVGPWSCFFLFFDHARVVAAVVPSHRARTVLYMLLTLGGLFPLGYLV